MAQIINDLDLGSYLGRQVGTGLSSALGTLAQLKMNHILKKQQNMESMSALRGLGLSAGAAQQLSQFPEPIQKEIIKSVRDYLPLGEMFDKKEQENVSPYLNENQTVKYTPEQIMSSVLATSPMDQAVTTYLNTPSIRSSSSVPNKLIPSQPSQDISRASYPKPRTLAEAKLLQQQRKEQMALDKEARVEQRAINREYAPFIKDVREKNKAALEDDRRLNRMEQLINTKNLSRPRFVSLLNSLKHGVFGVGLDFTSMLTPETQEYDKLTQEFLKNAKNIFGSRITDADLNAFVRLLPDLSKDRAGKRRIIHNMRVANEGSKIKNKIMDDIIIENGGKVPPNLDMLVEQRADEPLKQLADRFNIGYQKPSKEKTLSQTLLPKVPNPLDFIFGKG